MGTNADGSSPTFPSASSSSKPKDDSSKPPLTPAAPSASTPSDSGTLHTETQTDNDSDARFLVSQGDKDKLIKANKKTISDLEKALTDAKDSLSRAEALRVKDKSKSGRFSNMFSGPPAGTNHKQYTVGLILPANTEFYNLPAEGVKPNTFFANLFGQTVQAPMNMLMHNPQKLQVSSSQSVSSATQTDAPASV